MRIKLAALIAIVSLATACSSSDTEPNRDAEPSAAETQALPAATCDLAGGMFTAQASSDGITMITFEGLDVPEAADSVLYSATIGAVQLGIKGFTSDDVIAFRFDSRTAEQTEVDAVLLSDTVASAAFYSRDLPGNAAAYRVVLNVDGDDVASCKAPLPY